MIRIDRPGMTEIGTDRESVSDGQRASYTKGARTETGRLTAPEARRTHRQGKDAGRCSSRRLCYPIWETFWGPKLATPPNA